VLPTLASMALISGCARWAFEPIGAGKNDVPSEQKSPWVNILGDVSPAYIIGMIALGAVAYHQVTTTEHKVAIIDKEMRSMSTSVALMERSIEQLTEALKRRCPPGSMMPGPALRRGGVYPDLDNFAVPPVHDTKLPNDIGHKG